MDEPSYQQRAREEAEADDAAVELLAQQQAFHPDGEPDQSVPGFFGQRSYTRWNYDSPWYWIGLVVVFALFALRGCLHG